MTRRKFFGVAIAGLASAIAAPLVRAKEIKPVDMDAAKLDFEAIRNIPEERVCAALGIPPVVLNLGQV